MTEKIYFQNQYQTELTAKIICITQEDNSFHVTLDKTIFYPEGGGQPCDLGTINDINVEYVFEKDDQVIHVLQKAPSGDTARCSIDFARRLDLMQQHSGQHLLSAVFYHSFGGETRSVHMGEEYCTVDLTGVNSDIFTLTAAEDKINKIITRDIEFRQYIVTEDEKAKIPLRRKSDITENIRIVEIADMDYSTCCGTHVNRSGELGLLKIIKAENYKGMIRIYYKCGKRALLDYRKKHNILTQTATYLSSDIESVYDKTKKSQEEFQAMITRIKRYKKEVAEYQAEDLIKAASGQFICKAFHDKNFEEINLLCNEIFNKGDYLLIFYSLPDKKLIFTYKGTFHLNCGSIFKEHIKQFNGKGGGGNTRAQAAFTDVDDMENFAALLREMI